MFGMFRVFGLAQACKVVHRVACRLEGVRSSRTSYELKGPVRSLRYTREEGVRSWDRKPAHLGKKQWP